MTRRKMLICACPDLAFDGRELADRLQQVGVKAELTPPLCTPDGLARFRRLTAAKSRPWLVAACGPEIHAGFFQSLAGKARCRWWMCVPAAIWKPRWAP